MNIEKINQEALEQAQLVAINMFEEYNNKWPCGHAWVEISNIKLSSKLGKELSKIGFSKKYGSRNVYKWIDPETTKTQNMDIQYSCAQKYAEILQKYNIDAFPNCRMD